ncbi:putative glucan synthasis protein [Opitutaceae bacterium TAV1]|nr:putative glucan synthasis protein [Opitutaceae bacterium TAV1]
MPFPISESEIEKTETRIGIRFPESFRNAMMSDNGGEVITDEDQWELFPFLDTSDRKRISRTSNDILRETAESRKWRGFPESGWSVANNGFGDHILFIRSKADPSKFEDTVYTFWHETGTIKILAKDFSELKKL